MTDLSFLQNVELTELHTHMGSSLSADILWDLAHQQGIRLPTKEFAAFKKIVTLYENKSYEEYLLMFDVPELIQSSPEAMLLAMDTAASGAFRTSNITTLEVRFCPWWRTRQGERDLDYIITYSIHGIERAMLKYPIKVGIILEMDRRLTPEENAIIVKKAIKYKSRGIIGIDLAGPVNRTEQSKKFNPKDIAEPVRLAHEAGLGVTIHTGEATGVDEMWAVIEQLKPQRIGHGIACVQDKKLMERLIADHIVLENCPSSNLHTSTIKNYDEMRQIFKTFLENGIQFTINTDGPALLNTTLKEEYEKLLENNILSPEQLLKCNEIATKASFIK
jgi:adenosine deaminase